MYLVNNKIQKSITLFFLSHTLCINKYIFLFTFFSSIQIAVHDTLNCAKYVFPKSVGTLCRNFYTKEKMSKIMRGEKGWGHHTYFQSHLQEISIFGGLVINSIINFCVFIG